MKVAGLKHSTQKVWGGKKSAQTLKGIWTFLIFFNSCISNTALPTALPVISSVMIKHYLKPTEKCYSEDLHTPSVQTNSIT